MVRPVLVAVAVWCVAAAVAIGVGLAAISLLGEGVTAQAVQPLSRDAVTRALAGARAEGGASAGPTGSSPAPSSAAPSSTASATPSPRRSGGSGPGHSVTRALTSSGGSAIARCTGGTAYLVSWSPAQGYEVDEYERGPDDRARVKFESESDDRKVRITVTCRNGVPVRSVETEVDD